MRAQLEILRYRGTIVEDARRSGVGAGLVFGGVEACCRYVGDTFVVSATACSDVSDFGIDLVLTFPEWSGGYVLVPGAVYAGNRFPVLPLRYPPMYPMEQGEVTQPVITDVPRLPTIHLLAGDASYPAIGLWCPRRGVARTIHFPAKTNLGYVGLRIEESDEALTIRVQFPGVRPERYTMVNTGSSSPDKGASLPVGWSMEAHVVTTEAETSSVDGLFALLDANRNRGVAPLERVALRPLSSAAELVRKVTVESRWCDAQGYFETADSDHGIPFQVGWTGGGITTFPLLESEDPIARRMANRNVTFICEQLQGPSGYFYGGYKNGPYNDGFDHPHAEHWVMVRKNGDMLLFLLRQILALEASGRVVPDAWKVSLRACANAFVRTWSSEGQLGQFVDVRDGRVVVGGSACGGTAIAGLALASHYFAEPRYLAVAEAVGAKYSIECVEPGLLTGGPGEILNAPDSESAFGLLEGYVVLWEATSDGKWLDLAVKTARQAASWVVPYDFPFPDDSTFGRLGMLTGGTVIANVQNKHSAPGICTLSPLSLLKLYRGTGDRRWLDLAVDISRALPQYVSSEERPIAAFDGRPMPAGWVNERVNMSDWEAPGCGVGEAFFGPCWAMTSVLLTALEMPGVYVDPTRGVLACADHVEARLENGVLTVTNPTPYDAEVKVLIDRDRTRPLGELWWRGATVVEVPSKGTAEVNSRLT